MTPSKNLRQFTVGRAAIGANALGALAIGAFALGAFAIGRLVVGRMTVHKANLKSVTIDDLTIARLHVRELVVTDSMITPVANPKYSGAMAQRGKIGHAAPITGNRGSGLLCRCPPACLPIEGRRCNPSSGTTWRGHTVDCRW
jgi:hypothetical protein